MDMEKGSDKRGRKTREGKKEITYPAMVGAFFDFRATVFFCCFAGPSGAGSEAEEAPVPEAAAAAARLRGLGAAPVGLAELDDSG